MKHDTKTTLVSGLFGAFCAIALAAIIAAAPPGIQTMPGLAITSPLALYHNGNLVAGTNTTVETVAAPTGNATTGFLMAGIANTATKTFTPATTGNFRLVFEGDATNNTATDGGKIQILWQLVATSASPANGAAVPGGATTCGSVQNYIGGTTTNPKVPFHKECVVTGLFVGQAYWFDLQFAAVTGGTFTLFDVDGIAQEL